MFFWKPELGFRFQTDKVSEIAGHWWVLAPERPDGGAVGEQGQG